MAVCFEGGVVLGADSRTTMGSYIANRSVFMLCILSVELMTFVSSRVTDKLTRMSFKRFSELR